MASKQRRKGFDYEREVKSVFENYGFLNVQRAYGSNGLSLPGCEEDVDVLADGYKIQCKRRKSAPKWMELGTCDMLVYREDRGESMVVLPLEKLLKLMEDE